LRFRVLGSGFMDSRFRVWDSGFTVKDVISSKGQSLVQGLGFRVQGLGLRDQGSGCRVYRLKSALSLWPSDPRSWHEKPSSDATDTVGYVTKSTMTPCCHVLAYTGS